MDNILTIVKLLNVIISHKIRIRNFRAVKVILLNIKKIKIGIVKYFLMS